MKPTLTKNIIFFLVLGATPLLAEDSSVAIKNTLLQSQSIYGVRYKSGNSPTLSVAQSFLGKLKEEGSIGAYQILDYVYESDNLTYLKSGFPRGGYVFDFKNLEKGAVRVRLMQFPEAKVLWEGVCKNSEGCVQELLNEYGMKETPVVQKIEPTVSETIPSVSESKESFFPEKGVYFEGGLGYGIIVGSDDRKVVKDNLWIDARVGYLLNENFGIHLEGGYFPSTARTFKNLSVSYFRIGPGLKFIKPLSKHWAAFGDVMMGYGMLSASVSGFSATKSGFAIGVDGGVTYKISRWFGVSPYLAIHEIYGRVNGQSASSLWFVPAVMANFVF